MEEGETFELFLTLSSPPKASVELEIVPDSGVTVEPTSLVFTPDNWSFEQGILIHAPEDEEVEQVLSSVVNIISSSSDENFNELTSEVEITVFDNEKSNPNSISGAVWNDTDLDGKIETDERGLQGWKVYLDQNQNQQHDEFEQYTLSDLNGHYRFFDLESGEYNVQIEMRPGFEQTLPLDKTFGRDDLVITSDLSNDKIELQDEVKITGFEDQFIEKIYDQIKPSTIYDGSGFTVVVLDTGIDTNHPHFGDDSDSDGQSDRIIFTKDFTNTNNNGEDVHGHGTHVAGIVGASTDTYYGVAPGADIISLKVLGDDGSGGVAGIRDALEWCVNNAEKYNIVSVNMSLGGPEFDQSAVTNGYYSAELAALKTLGVCVVSASGNSYGRVSEQGVAYPSSDINSWSVGAVFHSDTGLFQAGYATAYSTDKDVIVPFSQRDDELTSIMAPGALFPSSAVGGGTVILSGTSMASPVIAGTVAVVQQVALERLGRKLEPDEILKLLVETAETIFDGDDENDSVVNTNLSFPRVNIENLISAIEEQSGPQGYQYTLTQNTNIADANFGVTEFGSQEIILNDTKVVSAHSEIYSVDQTGVSYLGADGNDHFNIFVDNATLFGGEGADIFSLNSENFAGSINGGVGTDKLILNVSNESTP